MPTFNVLLGVSGGIAAYKACDLITKLRHLGGYAVRVIMTENAKQLVTEQLLASLCGHEVLCDFWEEAKQGSIDHIDITQQWAQLFVVAPATANVIGKFANGISDDYMSTAWLAAHCPKIVAPAMNTTMWNNPAVQRNVATLEGDGVEIVPPVEGLLACGTQGIGKLAHTDTIIAAVKRRKLAMELRELGALT